MDDKIQAYFGRLTGRELALETPISLTSAQTGAAHAWLTRNGVAFSPGALLSRNFSLRQLLDTQAGGGAAAAASAAQAAASAGAANGGAAFGGAALGGVGIDVQPHDILPKPRDFREDPFYAANFTAREIAHCLTRDEPRQAFAGLWAAKEAIVKARGQDTSGLVDLKSVEIVHDDHGRPTFAGAQLSITHAQAFSAAVCVLGVKDAGHEETHEAVPDVASPPVETGDGQDRASMVWKLMSLVGFASGLTALVLLLVMVAR